MALATPPSSGPAVNKEPLLSAKGDTSDVRILDLGPKLSLVLEKDVLVVKDGTAKKSSRACGFARQCTGAPATRTIPLYNILWAEIDDDVLTIDFAAQTSKVRLTADQLRLAVPPADSQSQATTAFISTLLARSYGPAARRKRAYVLVNPYAGPGGADKIWEKQVRPVFEAARMPLTVVRTTYSGEAVTLAEQLDIDAFDIVVPCSGDGLPHEVFNGLAKRADARRALGKLAVAHIPCGSGNAMSCNLYGTHRPSLAALAIVKGVSTPLDLVSVTQGIPDEDGEAGTGEVRRTISFLSQALGMIADLDIATEHLRFLGQHRFLVGFLKLAIQQKVYPCDIAVKVEVEKEGVKEHYRIQRSESNLGVGSGSEAASRVRDGSNSLGGESEATTAATEEGQSQGLGLPPLRYGTVKDKLPDGWELVPHEKLGNFYCGNMAYMAPDANFFSAALANDGLMDLITVDGDISPGKTIALQTSVETGHFFDSPLVGYKKVSAYRIVPRGTSGYVSIDGERFPFTPFQAEIHHGLGLVISKRGGFEAPGPRDWDSVTTTERLMA